MSDLKPSCVINSVVYKLGKRISDVSIDDISEVIQEPDSFIWLGLFEPDKAMLEKIREEFSLHELAIEDALNAHQRPKIEAYGDSLFIVIKTANHEGDRVAYGETHIFVGKNFLITVRHGSKYGHQKARERCEQNQRLFSKGAGYALYSLLDLIVDNYRPVVTQFEKRFEQLEADIFTRSV